MNGLLIRANFSIEIEIWRKVNGKGGKMKKLCESRKSK